MLELICSTDHVLCTVGVAWKHWKITVVTVVTSQAMFLLVCSMMFLSSLINTLFS